MVTSHLPFSQWTTAFADDQTLTELEKDSFLNEKYSRWVNFMGLPQIVW